MKTMKKIFVLLTLFCISFNLFSQENSEIDLSTDESKINSVFSEFIAGSLFDKVEIIKSVEVDSIPQVFFENSL